MTATLADLPATLSQRLKLTDCPVPNLEGECWVWIGPVGEKGYGQVYFDGRSAVRVHRLTYQLLVGEITAPQLDHLCRVKLCANPAHLEPVTNAINASRTEQATKTQCIRGHELSGHNLIIKSPKSGGRRQCRECKRLSRSGLIRNKAS